MICGYPQLLQILGWESKHTRALICIKIGSMVQHLQKCSCSTSEMAEVAKKTNKKWENVKMTFFGGIVNGIS
jgi:hypothetical protein